ncbi:MAG: hypothetical protein E7150_15460 [Bacillus sp. (in: Bacteria)]|nr:hypothetical protein [Bacillus sp. (in: firmicutes)]
MKGVSITIQNLTINDIKSEIKRFYSKGTVEKYYRLLTNGITTCVIRVEKMDGDLFILGGFQYYYTALQKTSTLEVKCLVYEYDGATRVDRLFRALNYAFVEKSRDWYLYNYFINALNQLGWSDHQIASRICIPLAEITKYKINSGMHLYYQAFAIEHNMEKLFNLINQSPLSIEHKKFLFNLAMIKEIKLTQTAVKAFVEYIKEGYTFDEEHVAAKDIFWEIVDYKSYIKKYYWKGICNNYFD